MPPLVSQFLLREKEGKYERWRGDGGGDGEEGGCS